MVNSRCVAKPVTRFENETAIPSSKHNKILLRSDS